MDYIEIKKDKNLSAEIHYNNKLRIINNSKNINKLLEICEKYGYKNLNKNCYFTEYAQEIAKEYNKYYNTKKFNIKVYNTVNNTIKLIRKNPYLGKEILFLGTLIALSTANSTSKKVPINPPFITEEVKNTNTSSLENDILTTEPINITKNTNTEKNNQEEINNMLNDKVPEFVFDYKNENSKNFENVSKYSDLFKKYGQMYGIDANLLMAIASQESGGKHYDLIYNYPAVGIMQIERSVFVNQEITAYNHLEEKEEKFLITENNITDLETNIKIGAMLLQFALEANNYNIPLGIQTYNFGTGNISQVLKMCESISGTPISEMKNNMEETEWRYYREFLNIGDPYYVEHVLSYLPNNKEITVKNRANQDITLKVVNEALKNKTI